MDKVTITFFQDKYLPEAEKLLKDNPDIFSESDCKAFRDDLLTYLLHDYHMTERIMVLLQEKIVAGLVMIEKDPDSESYFKITWLVIRNTQQHKGYGTKLMQYAFYEIKKLNGKYVYVETSNEKHNTFAKNFYLKLGFHKAGVLPHFYQHPLQGRKKSEDDVLYVKAVSKRG